MVEGAFLAGLIRPRPATTRSATPSGPGPGRKQALERLVAVGHDHRRRRPTAANETPLPGHAAAGAQLRQGRTSYFTDEVKELLLNKTNILGDDQQERYNAFFRGGLKIYTTLDPALQAAAEQAAATQLPDTRRAFDAAIVASTPRPARCGRWSAARVSTSCRST